MKIWREACCLLPGIAVGIAVLAGIFKNPEQYPEITYAASYIGETVQESDTVEASADEAKAADGTQEAVAKKKKKTAVQAAAAPKTATGVPADGTFTGTATCEVFAYDVSVDVTFRDGETVSISNLTMTGSEDEANEAYLQKAYKTMVKRILQAQGSDVDAVTGATYSSNAIVDAYLDAKAAAIAKNDNTEKKTTAKSTASKTAASQKKSSKLTDSSQIQEPTGTAQDGTYTVSTTCEPDETAMFEAYVLTADFTFADGKLTAVDNFTSTAEENRAYYLKAAQGKGSESGLVAQLLKRQSSQGLSAVSGATCSSKTIRDLYLLALTEATGETQTAKEEEMASATEAPVAEQEQTEGTDDASVQIPDTENEGSADEDSTEAEKNVKDGVYTVTVTVYPDEWEDFYEYDMTADVVFADGKLTAIENMQITDQSNLGYCTLAANGTAKQDGVVAQLLAKQCGSVDSVSGATCSSAAIVELYEKALALAQEAAAQEETAGQEDNMYAEDETYAEDEMYAEDEPAAENEDENETAAVTEDAKKEESAEEWTEEA